MAQNITLLGASYSDVPAVTLPKTGGGTATFDDTTDATATAADIASGKTAYVNGAKITGTSSGGVSADGVAMGTEPSGAVALTSNVSTIIERAFFKNTGMTSLSIQGSPYFSNYCFGSCTNLVSVSLPTVTRFYSSNYNTAQYVFNGCSKLEYVVLPSYGNYTVDSYNFQNCTSLIGFDIVNTNKFGANLFSGSSNFDTLVIRKTDSVPQLSNINAFNNTPFASGKSGGTLYVPNALISSYQSATAWSTILGYATNSIKSIESTATDPTAPIDLTTHYVDGTVIS